MVHVIVHGMLKMGPKKLSTCTEAIGKGVSQHAMTGGSQNVWVFFLAAQQERGSIVAHVHGLEEGCHVVPSKEQKDALCHAVAEVLVAHRPSSKLCVRGGRSVHPRTQSSDGRQIHLLSLGQHPPVEEIRL